MSLPRLCAAAALAALCLNAHATITNPHPQRAFVSAGGSDSNDCEILAPCRTIAIALTQVQAGGEVVILDSGGFGNQLAGTSGLAVITQSVTITAAPGVQAAMSMPSQVDGLQINAPGAVVSLRGLTLTQIPGTSGSIGVHILAAQQVNVDNCIIQNVDAGVLATSYTANLEVNLRNTVIDGVTFGIELNASSGSGALTQLNVKDSAILNTGAFDFNSSSATGIVVFDNVTAVIENARIGGFAFGVGMYAVTTGSMTVRDSVISNNVNMGLELNGPVYASLSRNTLVANRNSGNSAVGLDLAGSAQAYLDSNRISDNNTGVAVGTGTTARSYGNNTIQHNTVANVTGTLSTVAGQ